MLVKNMDALLYPEIVGRVTIRKLSSYLNIVNCCGGFALQAAFDGAELIVPMANVVPKIERFACISRSVRTRM
jgi:hypothetical protein